MILRRLNDCLKAPARPGLSLSLCASSGFSGGASISWGPFSGAARCRQFCDRKTTLDEFFKSSRLAAPQLSQFFFTKHNWTHRCRCVNRGGCSVHRMADNRLRPRGGSSVLRSPILKWRHRHPPTGLSRRLSRSIRRASRTLPSGCPRQGDVRGRVIYVQG